MSLLKRSSDRPYVPAEDVESQVFVKLLFLWLMIWTLVDRLLFLLILVLIFLGSVALLLAMHFYL